MGQAAVDLPNSTGNPPSPLSGADDLLSQMAGEEIERMLAETESAKTAAANDPFASQLDDLLNQLNSASPDLVTVEQIAIIPAALPEESVIAPAAENPVVDALDPIPAAAKEEEPVALPAVIEQPTTAAERQALTPPVDTLAAIEKAVETPSRVIAEDRTPILVKILELINSPFATCPDMLRDMLGKIAILTLMNSVGLILYVMLFRKH